MSDIVKCCACGAQHTEESWDALPTPPAGGELRVPEFREVHSCRNCECGSTLLRVFCADCAAEVHGEEHTCTDDTEADVAQLLCAFVLSKAGAFDRLASGL